MSQKENPEPKGLVFSLPISLTPAEISGALDRFYSEPTNRTIPISLAITWVGRKAKGSSEVELKGWESILRSISEGLPKQ